MRAGDLPCIGLDLGDVSLELVYVAESGTMTYRASEEGVGTRFLKVAPANVEPTLEAEVERLQWARHHLPVPDALAHGPTTEGGAWMLTAALPGVDATKSPLAERPERLAVALARGLLRFHDAPVEACPFSFRLSEALALADERVRRGKVIPERHFHPEHAHLTATDALRHLVDTRPPTEDLVLCHGDYCLPNVLLESDEVSGYVDLGELGVADRWSDLAVATWSLTWNLGRGFEDAFLSAYGVSRDDPRLRFYRLLYDIVS